MGESLDKLVGKQVYVRLEGGQTVTGVVQEAMMYESVLPPEAGKDEIVLIDNHIYGYDLSSEGWVRRAAMIPGDGASMKWAQLAAGDGKRLRRFKEVNPTPPVDPEPGSDTTDGGAKIVRI